MQTVRLNFQEDLHTGTQGVFSKVHFFSDLKINVFEKKEQGKEVKKKPKHVLQPECLQRLHPPVEDLGSLVAGEVLQLQRLLGEEGHGQVEVVVPQLPADRHEKRKKKKEEKGEFNWQFTETMGAMIPEGGQAGDSGRRPAGCTLHQNTAAKWRLAASQILHQTHGCMIRTGHRTVNMATRRFVPVLAPVNHMGPRSAFPHRPH